ncbi:protein 5NUC-like [Haemaphysalis longicornis]
MWGPVVLVALCFVVHVDNVSAYGKAFFRSSSLHLKILHTNDIHSHMRESDEWGMECRDTLRDRRGCFGGVARIALKVRELKRRHKNTLFLNAGGFFQGTLWYSVLRHKIVSYAMSRMGYDAIGLGNNEFDDGPQELAPFVREMKKSGVPVLATNVETSRDPIFMGMVLPKSEVLMMSGFKVALLAVVTRDTETIAQPGRVKILPVADSINKETWRLKQQGVKIFILISHLGFDADKRLAVTCPDLDVIVGGHSQTFLYTGTPPRQEDRKRVEGGYPFVVSRRSRPSCVVVQGYRYGKYLGHVELMFNHKGDPTHWRGAPILLDQRVGQDQQILRGLLPYKTVVKDALKKVAGSTKVLLEANDNVCRFRECNLVNLMADSFLDFFANRRSKVPHAWSDVSGAVINGGAVRESIRQNSNVTLDDLYRVTKIDNELVLLNMNGSQLHKMFEHAVANFTWWPELNGKFLQVSGFRVNYDLGRPAGWRVAWLKILCANCSVPRYEDVHFRKRYTIVTTSFIADGGDGFQFEKGILKRPAGVSAFDVFTKYFTKLSPIKTAEEGRIVVKNLPPRRKPTPTRPSPTPPFSPRPPHIQRPVPIQPQGPPFAQRPTQIQGPVPGQPGAPPLARRQPQIQGNAPGQPPASPFAPGQSQFPGPVSRQPQTPGPVPGPSPSAAFPPSQTTSPGFGTGPAQSAGMGQVPSPSAAFLPTQTPNLGFNTGPSQSAGLGSGLPPSATFVPSQAPSPGFGPSPAQSTGLGSGQSPTAGYRASQPLSPGIGQSPSPGTGFSPGELGPVPAQGTGLPQSQLGPLREPITAPASRQFGAVQTPNTGLGTGQLGLGQTSVPGPAPGKALNPGFPSAKAQIPPFLPGQTQNTGYGQAPTQTPSFPIDTTGPAGWTSA